MARTSKAARTTVRRSTGEAPRKVSLADPDAVPFDKAAVSPLLDAPMSASLCLLLCIEELRQMQLQALQEAGSVIGRASAETGGPRGLGDLFGLPAALTTGQVAAMARLSLECLGDLLELQRRWLEQVASTTARMAHDAQAHSRGRRRTSGGGSATHRADARRGHQLPRHLTFEFPVEKYAERSLPISVVGSSRPGGARADARAR